MRRHDICLNVCPESRLALEGLIANRNTPAKVIRRAKIVLATADGLGTNAIQRLTGKSKPCVWRWQERYIDEGIDGLKRDKMRPSRIPPLSDEMTFISLSTTTPRTRPRPYATGWRRIRAFMCTSRRPVCPWLNLVERFFA